MRTDTLQGLATALLLIACVLLGGGQGTPGDTACQLGAIALIAWVLARHASHPGSRLPAIAWLALVPFLLPALQLLPLPAALWQSAPAREALAADLAAAGAAVVHRGSLVPAATERAALWLLPAAAMFLSVLQLGAAWRARLLGVLVAAGLLSFLLGIAQVAGGSGSPLRFYAITNPGSAVGFFANRNHFASLMAVCLPLVLVGLAASLRSHPSEDTGRRVLRIAAGLGLAALVLLAVFISQSRAGVLLGMAGLVLAVPVALGLRRARGQGQGTRRALAAALLMGAVLVLNFALYGVMQRFERDASEDARFRYAPIVAEVATQQAPLGTGLGGFRRAFEAADPAQENTYVNQAHNDWAQLWLEGGWLGVGLMAAALAALAAAGWGAWRPAPGARAADTALRRVAWIGLLLLALHSLADYPLRTTAMLAVLGLLAACCTRPRGAEGESFPAARPANALPDGPGGRSLRSAFKH